MPDVLGEIVPGVGNEVWECAKAMGFTIEALEFEYMRLSDEERREREGAVFRKIRGGKSVIAL